MTALSYPLYQQPDHELRCYLFSCVYMMSMAAGWPSHAYKGPFLGMAVKEPRLREVMAVPVYLLFICVFGYFNFFF